MTEDQMREIFREMRDEPVPADSLARVRARIERPAGKKNWWKFAVPVAAAGCVVAGFLLVRPIRTRPAAPPSEIAPSEIAQVQPPPELPVRALTRPRRARPRHVEGAPVLIRIETADPDVVILLVN